MSDRALAFYHALPGPLRSVVATARGFQLRSWRYGPDSHRLVAEALERDRWSADRWKLWQEERLGEILHRASRSVPYYRAQWEERRRRGDRSPVDRLENWPVLAKDTLRAQPAAFVAEDCDVRAMYHEHTSGTTGKPLDLWWSRQTVRAWFALFEARVRRWNSLDGSERWAMLGGQLVVPVERQTPPFWVWNAAMRQLYMSSYHLAPGTVAAYCEAMARTGVVYMMGYSSSMASLAQTAVEMGIEPPPLRLAVSNAEPLEESQRERIAAAFHCRVQETYGMAEIVCGASGCEVQTLHLWPEAGFVEVLGEDAEEPVGPGESGRLVCTSLLNVDMPLVRYAVGDRGALSRGSKACGCGRALPSLERVEGRLDDVVITPDGRRIGRLDPVFKANLPIREAQIIQEAIDRVRVRIVPAAGLQAEHLDSVRRRLMQRLGEAIEVVVETVDEIPKGPGGKFRGVVSLLPGRGAIGVKAPEPATAERR